MLRWLVSSNEALKRSVRMGTDLWLVRWEYLYDHLSSEEIDFIIGRFAPMDQGGGYAVDKETLDEISKEEQEKFKDLIEALKKAIEKEGEDAIQVDMG